MTRTNALTCAEATETLRGLLPSVGKRDAIRLATTIQLLSDKRDGYLDHIRTTFPADAAVGDLQAAASYRAYLCRLRKALQSHGVDLRSDPGGSANMIGKRIVVLQQ